LSKETTILDVVIRILQLKEKYVIHGALNTNTMFKGYNEVSNVGRIERLELVHHLVKFLTLKNFHESFAILIEQMMCQKCFICIQGDCKDFDIRGTRNLTFYQNLDFFQNLLTHTFYNRVHICRNPTLRQVWRWDSHSQKNGDWESSGTPATSELDNRGQNTLPWGVIYIVGKVLKCKCRKWPRMSHLDICSTSYGQKKGWESNWQFDSWPLKVGNWPDSDVCRRSVTWR